MDNIKQKEKIISLIILTAILITIWYMLDVVLITFIICFIFYNLLKVIQKLLIKCFPIAVPNGLILAIIYIIVLIGIALLLLSLYPKLQEQVIGLMNILKTFNVEDFRNAIDPRLAEILPYIDYNKYMSDASIFIANGATKVGGFGVNLFLGMLLSFFILLEQGKIQRFGESLAHSKISAIYEYIVTFGSNFVKTFSKVMKVQVMIAGINCALSMVVLAILGFPQIAGLGIMIFFLGLIPVAGVIISLVPLSIIAFNVGGIKMIIAVFIMIMLIHAIEAYILNPKLMSSKTELPVCFVFIILLIGEHYMGVWGLLIGVPIFIFLLNTCDVNFEEETKKRKKV